MVLEERIYTIRPGQMPAFLHGVQTRALPIQIRHLGGLVGYFVAETGELNQAVHLWAYADLEDRKRRRETLRSDPEWAGVGVELAGLVARMENRFLYPTAFSPLHWLPAGLAQPG